MSKFQRKQLAALLRSYPAMQTALKNLAEQIEAEANVVRVYQARMENGDDLDLKIMSEHLFLFENLNLQKSLLEAKINTVARSLEALSEEDREMLTAFYFEPYDRDTPFLLMERFRYEKSQLYYRRGRALDRFGENYGVSRLEKEEDAG